MELLNAVHLLTWCHFWSFKAMADCTNQDCDCGRTYLFCQDSRVSDHIIPLSLDLDTATQIPGGILPVNLIQFFLMESHVTSIQDAALDGSARTLDMMSFTKCKLNNIPDAFLSLKALKYLAISDTLIQDWNTNAMLNIGQTLESLSLSNVGLTVWPSWLKQFPRLMTMGMENSLISSIPDDAFDLMANSLISLRLNNSSVKEVPKAFARFTAINVLYLEHNMISNVTWLSEINTLSILDLTGNNISDPEGLSTALLPSAASLTNLDLDYNKLTSMPGLHLMNKITELDLTNNRISDPNSGAWPPNLYEVNLGNNLLPCIPRILRSLQSVNSLHLPFNLITEISASDFPPSVYTLELQYNLITQLTDSSFPKNCPLLSLQLNNNLISIISPSAFINLVSLWDLNLGGNKLVRPPLALAALTHLQSLDMTNNPGLICTCLEKSLQKLIASMSEHDVEGNCGQTSVYQFFTNLSTACPD